MKRFSSMALLWTLIAIIGGCGKPASEPPRQVPQGTASLAEPGDNDPTPAPGAGPPSAVEERPSAAPVDMPELAATEQADQPSEGEPAAKEGEKESSTRRVLGAVQQAFRKAAARQSKQEGPQPDELPQARP
jgi:hypothetical protein